MAAESVGLAASVAGLVSLGLQITGGILKYVDAFESRQDELEFVRSNSEALAATLRVIETWANSPGQGAEAIAAATRSMQLFEMELRSVRALHDELADLDGPDWTSRLANKKKKMTYAFSRSKIQDLGQRLQKATNALQLTLNALGLQGLRYQTDRMVAVEESAQAVASQAVLIRSEIAAVQTPMAVINDRLHSLQGGVDAASQLLVSQYGSLSNQIRESNDNGQATKDLMQQMMQLQLRQEEEANKRHQELADRFVGFMNQIQQNYEPDITKKAASCRLAGEPAFLKEISEAIRPLPQLGDETTTPDMPVHALHLRRGSPFAFRGHDPVTGRVCTCPRLQNLRQKRRFGLECASISGEWETISHWPDCPMAKRNSKKQVTLDFRYNVISRILKKAIHISFVWTSGAGGFSISPSFTCNPTVDDSHDPAFRIMTLLDEVLFMFSSLCLSTRERETFTITCMRRLAMLLDHGKAHPAGVNIRNESLMHCVMQTFWDQNASHIEEPGLESLFMEFIQMLLPYGVEAFTYDTRGNSPLITIDSTLFDRKPAQALMDILVLANSESRPAALDVSTMRKQGSESLAADVKRKYRLSLGFAEVCECGPLSLAVLKNDVEEVNRIIHCAPGTITERDIYGQSPFHLAGVWSNPNILEVLLQSVAQRHDLLKQRDISGFTALEATISHDSKSCTCSRGSINAECISCACIDLWTDTDCGIRMHESGQNDDAPSLSLILSTASKAARRKYASMMRTRWNSARRSAPSSSYTSPSCRELETACKSTEIERSTMIRMQHDEFHSNSEVSEDMGWIFSEISDPWIATIFHHHGFRPNISCLIHLGPTAELRQEGITPAYLEWLVSHGADLGFRSSDGPPVVDDSSNVGLFGAHFAFHFIGLCLYIPEYKTRKLWSTVHWKIPLDLLASVLRRNYTDGCSCHCTEEGCSPFTWMMKAENSMRQVYYRERPSLSDCVYVIVDHYMRCGLELTLLTHRAAIRYVTFVALDLTHTCCDARDITDGRGWVERDDVEIINEEQDTLLLKLEELVEEFEDEALQYLDTESNEHGSFTQFWPEYWLPRMDEEVNKLEGANLSDAEREADRKAAEEIGVRWVDTPKNVKRGNPYDRRTDLRYWLYELDQISPEYNEPWPEAMSRV